MSGMMFERIGDHSSKFDRLEALDRLAKSSSLISWFPANQFYRIEWKKIPRHPQKFVNCCSKSGRIIRSNCKNMTEASLDVHLKYLLELQNGR